MIIVITSKEEEERAALQFDLIESSTLLENLQKKAERTVEETEEMEMLTTRITALRKELGIEGDPVDPPVMEEEAEEEETEVVVAPEDAAAARRATVRQLKRRAREAGIDLAALLN